MKLGLWIHLVSFTRKRQNENIEKNMEKGKKEERDSRGERGRTSMKVKVEGKIEAWSLDLGVWGKGEKVMFTY